MTGKATKWPSQTTSVSIPTRFSTMKSPPTANTFCKSGIPFTAAGMILSIASPRANCRLSPAIFPLGGPAGAQTTVHLTGWNLPADTVTRDDRDVAPGIYPLTVRTDNYASPKVPFAVDTLPECFAQEGIHSQAAAQPVTLPVIVNGRIDKPGQWDVFRLEGRAGEEIVAEVIARRLDSPLDSVLRLTDDAGKQLAFNDDYEDKGAGLQTQYADSYLRVLLPAAGAYYLYLGDAQQQGGPDYAYRLRLSPPRPDFTLRAVPSSLSARGGMSVPLTIYALRRDGFSNAITLTLKDAPAGFKLSGNTVPASQDQVRISLTAPAQADAGVMELALEGRAQIGGEWVAHPAVPAEDMMQAFAYRHLVPSKQLEFCILDRPPLRIALQFVGPASVKIPSGGTAGVKVRTPGVAFTNNFRLELNAPPEGISIEGVSSVGTELQVLFHSDAAKIKPGAKGNLIVNVMAKNQPPARAAGTGARQPAPPPRGRPPRPRLRNRGALMTRFGRVRHCRTALAARSFSLPRSARPCGNHSIRQLWHGFRFTTRDAHSNFQMWPRTPRLWKNRQLRRARTRNGQTLRVGRRLRGGMT